MRTIAFIDKESPLGPGLVVSDSTKPDHLHLVIDNQSVTLNAVQVDKLRRVFHGWLHERANGEDGTNWVEEALQPVLFPVRMA